MGTVAVFGTVFVDCKGFAQKAYNPQGRNLGHIEFFHGGVARNVAENLAHLGAEVRFVSTVDESALAADVCSRLRAAGVDIDLAKKLTTAAPLHPMVLAFLRFGIRARAQPSGARNRNRSARFDYEHEYDYDYDLLGSPREIHCIRENCSRDRWSG